MDDDQVVMTVPLRKKEPWKLAWTRADQIEPEETKFLWHPYVPFGAVTLIAGKGGVGKSTVVCDIAARLSRGDPLPGQDTAYAPMRILMVSAEDDLSHKIVPTLLSFKANMKNIALSDEVFVLDDPHVGGIDAAMREFEATIVFIDPIVAYLGTDRDMNKSNDTRDFMSKLGRLARGSERAVIVVAHSRKNIGSNPSIDDVMGSADFSNAVRSGLLIFEREGFHILKHDKANWSIKGPSRRFTFEDGLTWGEEVSPGVSVSTKPRKIDEAKDFIMDTLVRSPQMMRDVISWGEALGFTEATLLKARVGLVKSTKIHNGWLWSLIEQPNPNPEQTFLEHGGKEALDPKLQALIDNAKQMIQSKAHD